MEFKTQIKKPEFNSDFEIDKLFQKNKGSVLVQKLKADPVVKEAAELLKKGELVALPTETVYGLAANAVDKTAVKKIFKAKGRPQDNPLIVHIANQSQLQDIVREIPPRAQKLIEKFWPGPLTLIFSKSKKIPAATSAGLDTVAVRMPAHPLMLAVIEASGLVLAAPSANRSGFPSPTKASHVYNDLNTKIPLILDGGPCHFGVESTVVDIRAEKAKILRPGGLSREKLAEFLGEELILAAPEAKADQAVLSPGMKYRHYAPQKKLFVFNAQSKKSVLKQALKKLESKKAKKNNSDGDFKKIALIVARETELEIPAEAEASFKILRVFNHQQPEELAKKLFALLRELDADLEVEEIYIEELNTAGIGEAVMNRILKAAAAEGDFQPGGGSN